MADILTPLQQRFLDEYLVNGGQQYLAYQSASPKASRTTCEVQSSKLMRMPKIAKVIAKSRAGIAQDVEVTQAKLVSELWDTYRASRDLDNVMAAKSCLDSLGKLCGFYVDRRETTISGAIDHRLAAYTDDQLTAVLAEISDRQPRLSIEGRVG